MSAKMFLYSQQTEDRLEERCRTCRSWRDRKHRPDVTAIVTYENQLKNLLIEAIKRLLDVYGDESPLETIMQHRGEFESVVLVLHERTGLSETWKPPIWASPVSDPDYGLQTA
jgi:hypothetical protein